MKLNEIRKLCLGENENLYHLEAVDILSPYLSVDFIGDLIKTLTPKEVYITTDTSCSEEIVSEIINKFRPKGIVKGVNIMVCDGIVHAKCYLFHWVNKETNKKRRLFLWGSCNATYGGFGRNAEVYSWINLSRVDKESKDKLVEYFSNIRHTNARYQTNKIQLDLASGLTIILPKLNMDNKLSIDSFDLWLQKGRLCHPFPNDPGFRHLKITLKNKIDTKDDLSQALKQNDIDLNQQATISFDYLRYNNDRKSHAKPDDEFESHWKSKYFVDTNYGLWTSNDCFKKNNANFVKKDYEERQKEIDIIANSTEEQRETWCNKFIEILNQIVVSIPNPSAYFNCDDNGLKIDEYKVSFKNQLNRDYLRSQDKWFKYGYISGFDFPEVPPMMESSYHWDKFVESFYEALSFEINKPKTKNLLAQTLQKIQQGKLYKQLPTDIEELHKQINENWIPNKTELEKFFNKK